jgi:hypothetical protein
MMRIQSRERRNGSRNRRSKKSRMKKNKMISDGVKGEGRAEGTIE